MNILEIGMALMIIGIGFVLAFLWLMIIFMGWMSKAVAYLNKIFPEPVEEVKKAVKKTSDNVEAAIALAIAAIRAKRHQ